MTKSHKHAPHCDGYGPGHDPCEGCVPLSAKQRALAYLAEHQVGQAFLLAATHAWHIVSWGTPLKGFDFHMGNDEMWRYHCDKGWEMSRLMLDRLAGIALEYRKALESPISTQKLRAPISQHDLRYCTVQNEPIPMNWAFVHSQTVEVQRCSECQEPIAIGHGEWLHNEIIDDSECTGILVSTGPAINFFYEVPFDDDVGLAGAKLQGLNVCAVELEDGRTGLALTGAGMDHSWEICAAHIALGFLPPFHFADQLSDRIDLLPNASEIVQAAIASAQAVQLRGSMTCRKLQHLADSIAKTRN